MKKDLKKENNIRKGGHKGEQMWRTHRLEGIVKKAGIKPKRKKKRQRNKKDLSINH